MASTGPLPPNRWPAEPNLGGAHLALRYVAAPVFLALGVAVLAGWLPFVAGAWALAAGAAALLAGAVSLVEARTRRCPGYTLAGIDTCRIAGPDEPPGADEPAAAEEAS